MNLNKAKCVPIQRGLPNSVGVEPKSANRRFHRDALRIYAVEQSLVEAPRNRAAPNKRNTEPHTLFIREGNYLDGQRPKESSPTKKTRCNGCWEVSLSAAMCRGVVANMVVPLPARREEGDRRRPRGIFEAPRDQVFAMDGKAQVGQEQPVFVPYFSTQFSTQWEASLEG